MFEAFIQSILAQLQAPKADIEKNIRALTEEMVSKMELVTYQEMERYLMQLSSAEARIKMLEQQLANSQTNMAQTNMTQVNSTQP